MNHLLTWGFASLQDHVFLCEGEDPRSGPKGELLFLCLPPSAVLW